MSRASARIPQPGEKKKAGVVWEKATTPALYAAEGQPTME